MRKDFTTTLEEIRVNNNLSQLEAAKQAGISKQTWNRIETGASKPRRTTLVKIAKAFNIDVDDIVTRQEKEQQNKEHQEKMIAVRSLELVNFTADLIKDDISKDVFLDELAFELQPFFTIDEKRLWVNVNTGAVARDREFKKVRIEQAINLSNNDRTRSIGDTLRKLLQYPRWWKHIELTNDANRKENHPLALLEKAVKGLKLKEDKDALIKEALKAEQTTESYLDYDNTEYITDNNAYENDEQFRKANLDVAFADWHKNRKDYIADDTSFYDLLSEQNELNSCDIKTFDQIAEEQSEKGDGYEVPASMAGGDAWSHYNDWLIKDAKKNGNFIDLVTARLNSGTYAEEELVSLYYRGELSLSDVGEVLLYMDYIPYRDGWSAQTALIANMLKDHKISIDEFEYLASAANLETDDVRMIGRLCHIDKKTINKITTGMMTPAGDNND